jgi:recombination protein RecT
LIISYKGMIALARRSGEILSIEARAVYERDTFSVRYGIDATVEHVPYLDGDPGKLKFAYAVAKLRDGGVQIDVMNRTQIDAIRTRSRAGQKGPWVTDYDEMAKKTVLRRLFKMLPVSAELAEAIEKGDAHEFGEPMNVGSAANCAASSSGRTGEVERALLLAGEEPQPFSFTSAEATKLAELIRNVPDPGELKKLEADVEKLAKSKGAVEADVVELRASIKRVAEEFAAIEENANAQ